MAGLLVSCGGGGPSSGPTPVSTPILVGTAAMAVDAVSGGAVDATAVVAEASPFDVDIVMLSANPGYQAYQYKLEWDPTILAYDGEKHLMPADLSVCADAVVTASNVYAGCARAGGNTTFTGPLSTVTLHCVGAGTSPLHLKTLAEDRAFGTSAVAQLGYFVDTTLTDASVTCQG
jgi:hypothetical protein